MQPSPQPEEYTEVFSSLLAESRTSVRRLAHLSGVSRRTLENWSDGTVRRPRHWEPVLQVARALHLPAPDTDRLLRAAGLPALASLQSAHLVGPQTDLLASWTMPLGMVLGHRSAAVSNRSNLPAAATPFFGREQTFQTLIDLIHRPDVRLVTVVGLGGVGKTRLTLEAARASVNLFDHGVYFVPLDSVRTADMFWESVANSLIIPRDATSSTERLVVDYLRNKRLLLLLDSFEHLSDMSAAMGELVQQSPELKLLVTSRQTLDLRAEHVLPMGGLSLAEGTESPAYQLFLQTARRRVPNYAPDPSEAADILAICEAVEGLPLALELAAAWVDILPPSRILTRLQSGLAHLHQQAADRPERQRNLWNVFDYSFLNLPEETQQAAMRLSVMVGSFTASAAMAIADCEPETLHTLNHSSLIRRLADGRLVIHNLVRQFLSEQAALAGLDRQTLEAAYMTYYMGWTAEQGRALREEMSAAAVRNLNREWTHVDRAWWLAADNNRGDLIDAAIDLLIYFEAHAAWSEGRAFFRATQDRLPADDLRTQARLAEAQAIMAVRIFDYLPSMQLAGQAINTFNALGVDPAEDVAGTYARLALWAVEYRVGQQEGADATVGSVLGAAGAHLSRFAETTYLLLRGVREAFEGDQLGAHRIFETTLESSLPGGYHAPNVRLFLAQSHAQLGDVVAARSEFERAWRGGYELHSYSAMVGSTFELRYLATDTPTAADCREALVELAKEMSDEATTGDVAVHLAVAYLTQGLFAKAGLLAWLGLSLLWDKVEPSARAVSLFSLAQTYLAFGQMPIAQTLLAQVVEQPGIGDETRLTAGGMLAMLGGPPPTSDEVEPLQVLYNALVSSDY